MALCISLCCQRAALCHVDLVTVTLHWALGACARTPRQRLLEQQAARAAYQAAPPKANELWPWLETKRAGTLHARGPGPTEPHVAVSDVPMRARARQGACLALSLSLSTDLPACSPLASKSGLPQSCASCADPPPPQCHVRPASVRVHVQDTHSRLSRAPGRKPRCAQCMPRVQHAQLGNSGGARPRRARARPPASPLQRRVPTARFVSAGGGDPPVARGGREWAMVQRAVQTLDARARLGGPRLPMTTHSPPTPTHRPHATGAGAPATPSIARNSHASTSMRGGADTSTASASSPQRPASSRALPANNGARLRTCARPNAGATMRRWRRWSAPGGQRREAVAHEVRLRVRVCAGEDERERVGREAAPAEEAAVARVRRSRMQGSSSRSPRTWQTVNRDHTTNDLTDAVSLAQTALARFA
ncbi:hypothetical protein HWV62_12755 [Athelia sp. TMB]|nr:hypothetical protein HWV62_12755 [Athelia sp. TMB]